MGYERSEVIGRHFADFLTEDSRERLHEDFPSHLERARNVPRQLRKKSGEIVDVLVSAVTDRDKTGEIKRSMSIMVDVTERKRAEEALRAGEERYRSLYNDTPALMHSFDGDMRFISVSDYWLRSSATRGAR